MPANKKFKKEQNPKQQGDFVLEENLSPQDSEQPSAQVLKETDEAFEQLDLEPMNEQLDSEQPKAKQKQMDLQVDPQIEIEQEPVVEEHETTYIPPTLFKRLFDFLRSALASITR